MTNKKNIILENWTETTLGRVIEFKNEKLKMNNLTLDNYISTENLLPDRLGIQKSANLPNIPSVNAFKKDDTLFSNIRTYFKKVWFAKFDGGASNDVLIFTPKDESELDKKFLYYFISSNRFIDFTVISAKGTKMPRGDKEAMKNFPILLPPLPEQQAIAQVLSSFDDKIELLREENKTLEELGQTIFKEWFGKYSINDELPEGWRVGKLGEELVIKQGRYLEVENLSEFQTEQRKYPIYGANGIRGYIDTYTYETPKVVFGCRGLCGNPRLSEKKSSITNTCMALENEKSFLSSEFIYFLSKKIDFESVTSGSAQPQITVTNLYNLEIVIPNHKILQRFDEVIYPIFTKIRNNLEQIQSLARTRDELLPRLMSGEMRVKNFTTN